MPGSRDGGAVERAERRAQDVAIRLALALSASMKVEQVLRRSVSTLQDADPRVRWSILKRVGPGRFRAYAERGWSAADLRRLADEACGSETMLCIESIEPDAGIKDRLCWRGLPADDCESAEADLVVAALGAMANHCPPILAGCADLIARAVESARTLESLIDQATRDPLTRLLNRRGILEALNSEESRARRHGRPLSLLFLDLDRFKEINDGYGHHVGDEVLVGLSRRLSRSLRSSDPVGRLGGDEFVVVLPDTSLRSALGIARRLARRVASRPVVTAAGPVRVKATIGVSGLDEQSPTESLLARADLRMLDHKRALHGEPVPIPAGVAAGETSWARAMGT